jgi:hypothetical protein
MNDEHDKMHRALEALNAILVWLRMLASEEKSSRKMFEILDAAELLPLLLLKGEKGYQEFEVMVADLAERYPRECGLALQRFKGDRPT